MELNGVIVINKPQDMTSHDVVAILRKKLKTKKVGHTGTLDPMATGVLPVCIGRATKLVDFLMDQKKGYRCEMVLGIETDTQDCWGTPINRCDGFDVSEAQILSVIQSFIGEIDQIPPMYSALKVGGEKLVDLARKGIVIEREARKRVIYSITDIAVRHHTISFDVSCSKGTYIRTLCHDIGLKLGCYGHMTKLERIYTEPFVIDQAVTLEQLTLENAAEYMIDVETAISYMPMININGNEALIRAVSNGHRINFARDSNLTLDAPFYRLYINQVFWGIGERSPEGLFMKKVFKD